VLIDEADGALAPGQFGVADDAIKRLEDEIAARNTSRWKQQLAGLQKDRDVVRSLDEVFAAAGGSPGKPAK